MATQRIAKVVKSLPNHMSDMTHRSALIVVSLAGPQPDLGLHGKTMNTIRTSALRGVPVYSASFAANRCHGRMASWLS